jgi:hypothetical protein
VYYKYNMKKYFQLLVEGKRDDDWGAYFANLKKNIKPYGKQLVHGETGKIVTTGPTDSQHYDIVLSNLGQFGFHSRQHMVDTVNAHNANNPNYEPLTSTSILSEEKGFGPVIDYLQDQGWAHVTHQPSDRRPTTYIRTANHAAAQSAMSVIKDQLLPEVSIETKTDVSELRSRQEIEHYRTSTDPSALIYTDRKPTIGTRQPTDAEKYDADRIIRKTIPKYKMEAESFTFSELRTQLNEEHDDLIDEMHPIMFIHTDRTFPIYHDIAGNTNRKTHDQIAKDAIENHYTKRPSGNLSDQLLSLGPWTRLHTYPAPRTSGSPGQKTFEIESASHEALRDTLRRIEPHISGHKVHIAVGDWSRRVDAEQLRDYIKHGHQTHSLRVESWQEYDAKVGETNTSLFEPGNTKFDMKAFLKKLRKKNRVGVNLPGEN